MCSSSDTPDDESEFTIPLGSTSCCIINLIAMDVVLLGTNGSEANLPLDDLKQLLIELRKPRLSLVAEYLWGDTPPGCGVVAKTSMK